MSYVLWLIEDVVTGGSGYHIPYPHAVETREELNNYFKFQNVRVIMRSGHEAKEFFIREQDFLLREIREGRIRSSVLR